MKLLIISYHDHIFHPIHVLALCYIFSVLHLSLWVIPGLTPWSCRPVLGQINGLELQQSPYFHLKIILLFLHLPALPIYVLVTQNLCHSPHTIQPALFITMPLDDHISLPSSVNYFQVLILSTYFCIHSYCHNLFSLRSAGSSF